jgi:Arc/MetJ-type ribon-helix-helix transcriptional regulator
LSRHYIKYPIAYDTKLKSLIDINDVHQENKGNLVCQDCNENFVAVLNHKTPHFKHKPNSKCTGNVESYLHWITKECFDLISEIELPEIFIEDLESLIKRDLKESIDELIKSKVPKDLQREFEKDLKKTISASKTFTIQSHNIEKTYKTDLGDVRIDVVAIINNQDVIGN